LPSRCCAASRTARRLRLPRCRTKCARWLRPVATAKPTLPERRSGG
jgi:hypothetical protein